MLVRGDPSRASGRSKTFTRRDGDDLLADHSGPTYRISAARVWKHRDRAGEYVGQGRRQARLQRDRVAGGFLAAGDQNERGDASGGHLHFVEAERMPRRLWHGCRPNLHRAVGVAKIDRRFCQVTAGARNQR